MTGIVICNGSIKDYEFYKKYFTDSNLVICADGGAMHAKKLGIIPDLLVGDFDSTPKEILDYFNDLNVEILRFPVEKDFTDTELATEIAIKKGCKEIIFIGALGTRIDHSIANIHILKSMRDKGIESRIIDEHNEITAIDESIMLRSEKGYKITLLPLTEKVEGVTTSGMYYPLVNATIKMGETVGVSNEFASEIAEVKIKTGILLVILSKD